MSLDRVSTQRWTSARLRRCGVVCSLGRGSSNFGLKPASDIVIHSIKDADSPNKQSPLYHSSCSCLGRAGTMLSFEGTHDHATFSILTARQVCRANLREPIVTYIGSSEHVLKDLIFEARKARMILKRHAIAWTFLYKGSLHGDDLGRLLPGLKMTEGHRVTANWQSLDVAAGGLDEIEMREGDVLCHDSFQSPLSWMKKSSRDETFFLIRFAG